MQAADLFTHCVSLLDTFRALDVSADSHAEDYLTQHKITQQVDRGFLLEIFGGFIRHQKVVDIVVDTFYRTDGRIYVKTEKNLFSIACYVIIFRTGEMGIGKLIDFICSQDWAKMLKFCKFFINKENLLTWIKDEWHKVYEDEFVSEHLLGPIMDNFEALRTMIKVLADLVSGDIGNKVATPFKKELTIPEPFNLTQPQPRKIPTPKVIPKMTSAKRVPESTYVEPETEKKLYVKREENRRKAEVNLLRANQMQFSCAAKGKSEKTLERIEYLKEREMTKPAPIKANPAPFSVKANEVPVKLNMATILREEKHFKAKEESIIETLENLQAGAKDASEFNQWQSEMRQKDYDKAMADIERRRLEGLLSHEEAILARKRAAAANHERANEVKEEAARRMREYVGMKLKETAEMRQLVEEVITGHENAKLAKKKIQQMKLKLAQEMNKENKELLRVAFEEAETEMAQKQEIIRQIRAIESVPRPRYKQFDPTEIVGFGFFGEMSLAELRERLQLVKVKEETEQAERRDGILQGKREKEEAILEAMDTINRHRTEQTRAAAIRLEEKRREIKRAKEVSKDPEVLRLQELLEKKKQERLSREAMENYKPSISAIRMSDLKKEGELVQAGRFRSIEDTDENLARKNAMGFGASARAARIAIG